MELYNPALKLKAVSHTGPNNGRMISLPTAWVRDHTDPSQIYMAVGNIILVSTEEDAELLTRAVAVLEEAGLFTVLEKNMQRVL